MSASRWPPRQVLSFEQKLRELVAGLSNPGINRPDEDIVWLTRFLISRASGYVEQVSYSVVRGYIEQKSGGYVRSFANSWIERTRNPSPGNLKVLLGRFDAQIADDFQDFLDETVAGTSSTRGEYLDLLVNKRNQIAHGANEGLSLSGALRLAEVATDVADWFVRTLNPDTKADWQSR